MYTVLPTWLAVTVHVPGANRAIMAPLVPLALHTVGVVVVKVTGNADDAVAVTVIGDCASVFAVWAAKVIVWAAFETVKLWLTVGAGS